MLFEIAAMWGPKLSYVDISEFLKLREQSQKGVYTYIPLKFRIGSMTPTDWKPGIRPLQQQPRSSWPGKIRGGRDSTSKQNLNYTYIAAINTLYKKPLKVTPRSVITKFCLDEMPWDRLKGLFQRFTGFRIGLRR